MKLLEKFNWSLLLLVKHLARRAKEILGTESFLEREVGQSSDTVKEKREWQSDKPVTFRVLKRSLKVLGGWQMAGHPRAVKTPNGKKAPVTQRV